MVKKWAFFAKLHTCPFKVYIFFILFLFESPKNSLQDVGSRFFNFIIFLAIIILEKLEMLEIYKKNQIIYYTIEKT